MIYFTGCTHFGHYNIIKLANRPFNSVLQMNNVLIENWNKTVKPSDTIIHLGDFAYKGESPENYIKKLNGNIIRIQGNHDPKNWGHKYYDFRYNNTKVVCFHYPIEEWDGWYHDSIHIHCHTHKPVLKSAERRFNVTVEACNYKPISIDELLELR